MTSIGETDLGVSEVIGFLLIIGISLTAASLYQVNTIPQEELSTEVAHESQVAQDLSQLRQNILFTASSGNGRTTSVKLGTRYTEGVGLFVYSLPPSGTIETIDTTQYPVVIINAQGLGPAENYWSGEIQGDEPEEAYFTDLLRYNVDYAQYNADPTFVYEHTFLYEEYEQQGTTTKVLQSDQNMVDGRNINLVMLEGDFSQNSVNPASVETRPVSANPNTISVTNTGNGAIKIRIPTTLTADEWNNRLLDNEPYAQAVEIDDPDPNDNINYITIGFQQGVTYQLTMSKVYLSTQQQSSAAASPVPRYVAWKGTDDVNVRENSRLPINAEVRDKYNNPVGGAYVEATARDGQGDCIGDFQSAQDDSACSNSGYFQPGQERSGDDGEVQFVYEAPEVSGDRNINIELCLGVDCSTS